MKKVTNIRPYISERLRKEIREAEEKYCEHCGETKEDCPGYKCWIQEETCKQTKKCQTHFMSGLIHAL